MLNNRVGAGVAARDGSGCIKMFFGMHNSTLRIEIGKMFNDVPVVLRSLRKSSIEATAL
jgi:hypothetical protein